MTAETDRPDDTALAAEYALRLMDPVERRAFERRLDAEPALRALVRDWDEEFSGLADGFHETPPPPRLKAAVERRLFGLGRSGASPLRLLLGALVAAGIGAAVLLIAPFGPVQAPSLTAEIAAEDRSLVVEARLVGETLEVTRAAGAAPPGRVLELWLIAAGADAPVSLGVLPEDGRAALPLDAATRAALAGATLAVSEEPPGGSPTGAPTGAVLAAGPVTEA
jgi:anti-sigma-K factor RskA